MLKPFGVSAQNCLDPNKKQNFQVFTCTASYFLEPILVSRELELGMDLS